MLGLWRVIRSEHYHYNRKSSTRSLDPRAWRKLSGERYSYRCKWHQSLSDDRMSSRRPPPETIARTAAISNTQPARASRQPRTRTFTPQPSAPASTLQQATVDSPAPPLASASLVLPPTTPDPRLVPERFLLPAVLAPGPSSRVVAGTPY